MTDKILIYCYIGIAITPVLLFCLIRSRLRSRMIAGLVENKEDSGNLSLLFPLAIVGFVVLQIFALMIPFLGLLNPSEPSVFTLAIESTPSAIVSIDMKQYGSTPISVSLEKGTHKLNIKSPTGFASVESLIVVNEVSPKKVAFALTPKPISLPIKPPVTISVEPPILEGTLYVDAKPKGGYCYIKDKQGNRSEKNSLPFEDKLPPGTYRVEIVVPDCEPKRYEYEVSVVANQKTKKVFTPKCLTTEVYVFEVYSIQEAGNTKAYIYAGDEISINVKQVTKITWDKSLRDGGSSGPNGSPQPAQRLVRGEKFLCPSAPAGSLVGRIGEKGNWFFVGETLNMVSQAEGNLYLSVNDRIHEFDDNFGLWVAQIVVENKH